MNGGSDGAAAMTTAKSEMPSRTPEPIAQQTGDTGHVGSTREAATIETQQPTQQMGSGLTTENLAPVSGSAADAKTNSAMSDGPMDNRANPLAAISAEQVEKLCVIVLDVDLMAQALYKLNCIRARIAGTPEPPDPGLGLQQEERKLVHEAIATPAHVAALLYLWASFQRAKDAGAEAMFALPPPFPSLTSSDRDLMRHVLATAEERQFLHYLYQRRAARLRGTKPPPAEPLRLSQPMQKAIRRLDRDERAQVYLKSCIPKQ